MTTDPIRLEVVVGSVRTGRFGPVVADWFVRLAQDDPRFAITVLDLAVADLPVDHTDSPQVQRFRSRIDAADAFVFVTPEYNHGYPAALKNAVDAAKEEWRGKPVGFVSYGGLSGGLRATEQLRQVAAEVHMVSVRQTVSFHRARKRFDVAGNTDDGAAIDGHGRLLDQLSWWADAVRGVRADRPYPA